MTHPLSSDTSREADAKQFEILSRMTFEEKANLMTALTLSVQELAMAGMRERFPSECDDQLRLRLAVQRLGEETVRRVWRREP